MEIDVDLVAFSARAVDLLFMERCISNPLASIPATERVSKSPVNFDVSFYSRAIWRSLALSFCHPVKAESVDSPFCLFVFLGYMARA